MTWSTMMATSMKMEIFCTVGRESLSVIDVLTRTVTKKELGASAGKGSPGQLDGERL